VLLGLSLAEIDKGVAADYPEYDHKPALMRAYRWHKDSSAHMLCPYATSAYRAADRDGNGFVTRREFKRLLRFIPYFNGLWAQFESVDPEGDRRLTMAEFGQARPRARPRAVAPGTPPPSRLVNLVRGGRGAARGSRTVRPNPRRARRSGTGWRRPRSCGRSSRRRARSEYCADFTMVKCCLVTVFHSKIRPKMPRQAGESLLFEDFCGWCARRHVGAGAADSDEEVGARPRRRFRNRGCRSS
jgi:hypothetical protein